MNNLIKAINELKKEKNQSFWGTTTRKVKYKISPLRWRQSGVGSTGCQNGGGYHCDVRVHFMGETAKVLCPDKKVLVPDMEAGCSLADVVRRISLRSLSKSIRDIQ